MKYKIYKIFFLSFFLLFYNGESFSQQNCNTLPKSFKSYNEAMLKVETAKFITTDFIAGKFSSWIDEAKYYSCDNLQGYLIVKANGRKYIHLKVPISIWKNFKNSTSKGSFYNNNFKGKYSSL